MRHFVLEIGVEEMPARFLPLLDRELAERFSAQLSEAGLEFGRVATASTPRRLVVDITGLADVQKIEEIVVSGPPARIAFDADGNLLVTMLSTSPPGEPMGMLLRCDVGAAPAAGIPALDMARARGFMMA